MIPTVPTRELVLYGFIRWVVRNTAARHAGRFFDVADSIEITK
jgi:hypothetical protein